MTLRDNELQYLDAMIDAYAAVSAYVSRIPELEDKIATAYRQVCRSRPEFDSFNAILGRGYSRRELWGRHIAWLSQHAFSNRAYCVGNKILLQKDDHLTSPFVGQLCRLGFEPYLAKFEGNWLSLWTSPGAQKLLDAMVVDRPTNQVFLIKGVNYSATRRPGYRRESGEGLPLFDQPPKLGASLHIRPVVVRTLHVAYSIVRAAFPQLRVTPAVLVADEVGHGWHYEAYDLASAMSNVESRERRCLADYPRIGAIDDLIRSGLDRDELRYLPSWVASNPLRKLPVDRATRCILILNTLWNKQREFHKHLAVLKAPQIAKVISGEYAIEYPADLRRHDLEDCLERGGLIERPAFEGNAYALTARGLARILLAKRLFAGASDLEDDDDLQMHLLSHVHKQAEIWAEYRSGRAVCV